MCDYCLADNNPSLIEEERAHGDLFVFLEKNKLLAEAYSYGNTLAGNVTIKYCPVCGSELAAD